jgi:N utilization substance protein A
VLIDFGLPDNLAEKLVAAGIGSVEKLGAMTPEDLEAIQGIGPKMVEKIQDAVNMYYGQFEVSDEGAAVAEGETAAEEPVAEAEGVVAPEAEAAPPEAAPDAEPAAEASAAETPAAESDTIKDSGHTAEGEETESPAV